jgi:adenosylcobyric acid synthase
MVCGTASDVGKSAVVAGLCRVLSRRGVKVAPFKAQNMALNSWVTLAGAEIGRAQGVQAAAAGVEADVSMNPILLKPTGERTSQVIVLGRPWAELDARDYHAAKPALFSLVLDTLVELRSRFDVVLCEGAGSPAEINLLDHDLVNLRLAEAANLPAVLVGDIDRGGVFAALYGTVALLPDALRSRVQGFIVNKFRGDPALLVPGFASLTERTGVPSLGVLPLLDGVLLDAEDSLGLGTGWSSPVGSRPTGRLLDVAVIGFPRLSNVTDVDPLAAEPGVALRLVTHVGALGDPDLVVLPGTKATVLDLEWLQGNGLAAALRRKIRTRGGPVVLGICGGFQMMGVRIVDQVESQRGVVDGLGWLPHDTVFGPEKIVRRVTGVTAPGTLFPGEEITGYEIRHGAPSAASDVPASIADTVSPWFVLEGGPPPADGALCTEGLADFSGGVFGTSVHGLFENDGFRRAFLDHVAQRRNRLFVPGSWCFAAIRSARFDRLADAIEEHLNVEILLDLIAEGSRT